MAEAFVRTIKRDYVCVNPCPDAKTVMRQVAAWITHYNEVPRSWPHNVPPTCSNLSQA